MITAQERNSGSENAPPRTSIRWLRIIPVALIMYTIAFIDRTNISLALPHILRDLSLDSQQAGTVAGIFSGAIFRSKFLAVTWLNTGARRNLSASSWLPGASLRSAVAWLARI